MEENTIILQEIREISPAVANIGNLNVYTVPKGFFENLSFEILSKITETQLPGASNPFQVPVGYFEGISDAVLKKIHTQENQNEFSAEVFDELQQTAPLLNTISKKNVYAVPDGYFEDLSVNVTIKKRETPVIPFRRSAKKWFSYAAAACILAVISTGIYFFIENNNKKDQTPELVNVDVVPYKTITNMDIDKGIAGLSDDEITNYLNTQTISTDIIPDTDDIEDTDTGVEQMLDNSSDDELNQYLKDNSEPRKKNI